MGKTLMVALVAVLLFTRYIYSAEVEKSISVPNADFEADIDEDGFPDGWIGTGQQGEAEAKLSSEKYHSMEFSLRLITKKASNIGLASSVIYIPLDQIYELRGWFLVPGDKEPPLTFSLIYYTPDVRFLGEEQEGSLTADFKKGEWTKGTYRFFASSKYGGAEVGCERVVIGLGLSSEIYIDDIELVMISSTAQEIEKIKEKREKSIRVPNNGFELGVNKDNFPDAWMGTAAKGTVEQLRSREKAHSGKYSFKLTTGPDSRVSVASDVIGIKTDNKYEISAYFLSDFEEKPVTFTVIYYDNEGRCLGEDVKGELSIPIKKGKWMRGTYTFLCPQKYGDREISAIRITLGLGPDSAVYVDDVEFMRQ